MPQLNMQGPHNLETNTINNVVTPHSIGNYALGYTNDKGTFYVCYVGRSDTNLQERLRSWISNTTRPLFKYSYAQSPLEAFNKECKNYHEFTPSDNTIHPDKPNGTSHNCPICPPNPNNIFSGLL